MCASAHRTTLHKQQPSTDLFGWQVRFHPGVSSCGGCWHLGWDSSCGDCSAFCRTPNISDSTCKRVARSLLSLVTTKCSSTRFKLPGLHCSVRSALRVWLAHRPPTTAGYQGAVLVPHSPCVESTPCGSLSDGLVLGGSAGPTMTRLSRGCLAEGYGHSLRRHLSLGELQDLGFWILVE